MARTNAIGMLSGANTPATLAEIYGFVIDNIQKESLSTAMKSTLFTGDAAAGSVEFKRFVNADPKAYGTARTAGKGDAITAPPTTVNLDTHKEIVEELPKFDLDTFGIAGMMQRRADNHTQRMAAGLDRAFFAAATAAATAFTTSETEIAAVLEELIQTVETTENEYVDGVDRDLIDIILTPQQYGKIRTFLDVQSNPNVDTAGENFGMYHGVRIYSGTRLPAGVDALCMVRGSVAMPVCVHAYTQPERIPLSNDYAVSLFYDYGVKALTPDLIYQWTA